MDNKTTALGLTLLAATVSAASAQTTAAASAAAPAVSPAEKKIQEIKNPVSWFKWGGDLRFRNEYYNNAASLSGDLGYHEQDYFRFRGRLWTSISPDEHFSLNTRIAAEPRNFMKPRNAAGNSGMEWRYGIIDNLNVKWSNGFDLPMTLTVGRQDILLGDGWLVGDGTPQDGSWTYYMDAARLTYELKDQKTTIDAIGLAQFARPDAWLPTLDNSNGYFVTDQNEKGAILNVANKSLPYANLTGYFIYKHDTSVNNAPAMTTGDNGDIYTLGGQVSGVFANNWKYSVEGAYQFGEKKDQRLVNSAGGAAAAADYHNLSAFGLTSKLIYMFKDKMNNQVKLNYEYLGGDDPNTGTDEMFDVLWGRWPQWSELYNPYSNIKESRIGQIGNTHRIGPGWSFSPIKNMDYAFNYYALFADQDTPTRASAATAGMFSGDGNFRGHYIQSVLKYKFCAHVSGHLWSEFLFPGDYYNNKDMMTFLRAELMFTF